MTAADASGLTRLDQKTKAPASPGTAVPERVPAGQPDFAPGVIDDIPDDWLADSKSLKLCLRSFRNHGAPRGLHHPTSASGWLTS